MNVKLLRTLAYAAKAEHSEIVGVMLSPKEYLRLIQSLEPGEHVMPDDEGRMIVAGLRVGVVDPL